MPPGDETSGLDEAPETIAQDLFKHKEFCRKMLESLDEGPKRRSGLKPLLRGRGDESLNVCLAFLQEESLIERRTDAREEVAVHRYEISPLGEQVLSFIGEHSWAAED